MPDVITNIADGGADGDEPNRTQSMQQSGQTNEALGKD